MAGDPKVDPEAGGAFWGTPEASAPPAHLRQPAPAVAAFPSAGSLPTPGRKNWPVAVGVPPAARGRAAPWTPCFAPGGQGA